MEQFSLVAFATVELTQGGAELARARSGLPWAMVFNALGVLSWCTDFSRRPALVCTDFSRNLRPPEDSQGGAELAGARSRLPWATVFNALGVLSWCTDFSRRPALVYRLQSASILSG